MSFINRILLIVYWILILLRCGGAMYIVILQLLVKHFFKYIIESIISMILHYQAQVSELSCDLIDV